MPKSFFVGMLLALGALAANLLSSAQAEEQKAAAKRMNVVLFLADDLGFMDIGANNPQTFYETPRINSIAAKGMRFTRGYSACCVCSPTRGSIMTGRYPTRYGITNFIDGKKPGKLQPPINVTQLPAEETTMAEHFRDAGYTTFFAGKWHLGGAGSLPQDHGFMVGLNEGGRMMFPAKQPVKPIAEDGKLTDIISQTAVEFIKEHKDKPFFAYLPYNAPHIPVAAREKLIAKYREKAKSAPADAFAPDGEFQVRQVQNQPDYAAMMEQFDEGVGRVLDTLDELDLTKQTIIVFVADNGGLSTAEGKPTSNVPLRTGKGWPYEGGVRVPLFVMAPGHTKASSLCETPICTIDLLPTLMELAGVPASTKSPAAGPVDGVSIVPLLDGKTIAERPLFWHYPHYSNQGGNPHGAIREGNFKLVEWYEGNPLELYDLSKDISEKQNIAADHPDLVKSMHAKLIAWRKETGAKMPLPIATPK